VAGGRGQRAVVGAQGEDEVGVGGVDVRDAQAGQVDGSGLSFGADDGGGQAATGRSVVDRRDVDGDGAERHLAAAVHVVGLQGEGRGAVAGQVLGPLIRDVAVDGQPGLEDVAAPEERQCSSARARDGDTGRGGGGERAHIDRQDQRVVPVHGIDGAENNAGKVEAGIDVFGRRHAGRQARGSGGVVDLGQVDLDRAECNVAVAVAIVGGDGQGRGGGAVGVRRAGIGDGRGSAQVGPDGRHGAGQGQRAGPGAGHGNAARRGCRQGAGVYRQGEHEVGVGGVHVTEGGGGQINRKGGVLVSGDGGGQAGQGRCVVRWLGVDGGTAGGNVAAANGVVDDQRQGVDAGTTRVRGTRIGDPSTVQERLNLFNWPGEAQGGASRAGGDKARREGAGIVQRAARHTQDGLDLPRGGGNESGIGVVELQVREVKCHCRIRGRRDRGGESGCGWRVVDVGDVDGNRLDRRMVGRSPIGNPDRDGIGLVAGDIDVRGVGDGRS